MEAPGFETSLLRQRMLPAKRVPRESERRRSGVREFTNLRYARTFSPGFAARTKLPRSRTRPFSMRSMTELLVRGTHPGCSLIRKLSTDVPGRAEKKAQNSMVVTDDEDGRSAVGGLFRVIFGASGRAIRLSRFKFITLERLKLRATASIPLLCAGNSHEGGNFDRLHGGTEANQRETTQNRKSPVCCPIAASLDPNIDGRSGDDPLESGNSLRNRQISTWVPIGNHVILRRTGLRKTSAAPARWARFFREPTRSGKSLSPQVPEKAAKCKSDARLERHAAGCVRCDGKPAPPSRGDSREKFNRWKWKAVVTQRVSPSGA